MAFQTLKSQTSADVGSTGVKTFTSGVLTAADLNNAFGDELAPSRYQHLAGVVAAATIAVAALAVTIPSGIAYYASMVWINAESFTVSVPNSATTYIWGCSDGQVRTTTSPTPPNGFSVATACILTKATASGGTATLDATATQYGRVSDAANRKIKEGNFAIFDYANNRFDVSAGALVIPAGTSDPSTLVSGMVWYRTDAKQLCFRNGSTTERVNLATGGSITGVTAGSGLSSTGGTTPTLSLAIDRRTSDPVSPAAGQAWIRTDTTPETLCVYDGSTVLRASLATGGTVTTVDGMAGALVFKGDSIVNHTASGGEASFGISMSKRIFLGGLH